MKSTSQLFVGLLSATGSILLVLAAASLALLEGGVSPFQTIPPTETQAQPQPVIPTASSTPGLSVTVVTVTPQIPPTVMPTGTPSCTDKPVDWITYTIQAGDTIDSLVEQSAVSREDFLKANCFRNAPARLEPGWVVYLPPNVSATTTITATLTETPEPPLPTVCAAPPGWILYTVRPGDNLFRLSLAYGISQFELARANCLPGTLIYAGQRLYVPNRPTIVPSVTRTPILTSTPVAPTTTFTATITLTQPGKADQTIIFNPLADKTYGDPSFTVGAAASSGLPVNFAASGNCTVSANTVTITSAGSCSITASQPGNASFNPAIPATRTFQVNKASQTIVFAGISPKSYGESFNVSASASSGLPVSFSAQGNCTVVGTQVTLTGVGSCDITASQDGDSNYNPAPPVPQNFQISQASQSITFDPLPNKNNGDAPFTVSASASSGLPVSFSAQGNCTVVGTQVTLTGVGSCDITAIQNGDSNYLPAQTVTRSFTIN
jgi:LysM repeat protein